MDSVLLRIKNISLDVRIGCETLGIFDSCTDDLGEVGEEESTRSCEFITTDEPTVMTEPCLNASVVEDRERDGRFPDPPRTDESDRFESFGETNFNLLDQSVTSETGPRGRWREFPQGTAIQM